MGTTFLPAWHSFMSRAARRHTEQRERRRGRHVLEHAAIGVASVTLFVTMIPLLIAAGAFSVLLLPFFLPFLMQTHGEVFSEAPHAPPERADWLSPWPASPTQDETQTTLASEGDSHATLASESESHTTPPA